MFACESMLKNSSIATLEMQNNQARWWIKDAILTERAFYLFQEKGDLLGDEYDKLEMTQFRCNRVSQDDTAPHSAMGQGGLLAPPPPYLKQLPPFKMPFTHLIEMHNKKTQKRRVLACESAAQADEYVNLLNLVNSYLNYELLFSQDDLSSPYRSADNPQNGDGAITSTGGQASSGNPNSSSNQGQGRKTSGPIFITNWVQSYNSHLGCMEFKEECFDPQNFPYLLSFGRENDSIRSLVFPGDTIIFAGNEQHWMSTIQQVLSTFSRESVTQIIFRGNFLVDQVLKSLVSSISQYEHLTHLELSNNGLQNATLEALGIVFSNCPFLIKINLSNNLLGSGGSQAQALEIFFTHLLTEVDNPQSLDLSDNQFTDESLAPIVKFIFANEECRLQFFNLENNQFTSFGKRTLLKAYSLCANKSSLQFKCGPMPLTEATLKHAFNITYELKPLNPNQVLGNQNTTSGGDKAQQQKVLKTINSKDKLEMRIVRKPNYGGAFLRGLPVAKADRDKLHGIFAKLERMVNERHNVFIEDIRELLQEISQLTFEFPRHKLEPLFEVVNEKLFQSMECENIYCLEILLDCLRFMNARNIKAEEKYSELSVVAQGVGRDLLKVINMELLDDNELNAMLDNALNEARRIGMRGEIIDVAITLKMLRNNFLTEMQNKTQNSDDESQPHGDADHNQLELYGDDDKTLNVFDEKYEQYLEMSAEELGLTSEVEHNLGLHPYQSDYLKISNLNLHYVKKNLKEAQKFLRDEESYAYRNIYDRCHFLLYDSSTGVLSSGSPSVGLQSHNQLWSSSQGSKAYNLAKNDTNLKLARIIFRYKNGLDHLFPPKLEPYPSHPVYRTEAGGTTTDQSRRRQTLLPNQSLSIEQATTTNKKSPNNASNSYLLNYKHLLSKDYLEFNGTKLTHPITKIDKNKAPAAVGFNRCLFAICEGDELNKSTLYAKMQELFEEFVVKGNKLINEELTDEYYMQIYRQINRKNVQQSEKSAKAIANALFILVLYSRYATPSKDLVEGLESWLQQLKERSGGEFYRLIQTILHNFTIVKKLDSGGGASTTKPYCYWAPGFSEIEQVITGEPIMIQVYTPIGDVYQYQVDELTTVESLLTHHIWKEKFFAKEPDSEFYWLYQHVERGDQFDQPLSKDKRILKLLYKNEKTQGLLQRRSVYKDEPGALDDSMSSSQSPERRYSFIKKKSTKFLRKKTLYTQVDALQDNEYQSTILLIRKRLFTALHLDRNTKTLAKKPLNFLYHQVRMDYIEKNILRRLCNYEDVSLFAALVLKVKYWGKILRSKDNSLTKELIVKNIDYAIPSSFMREKSQDYWVQKIQRDFDRHNLRELSIEEAQERFLNQFAHYHLAFSTYYVVRAQSQRDSNTIEQLLNNQIASKTGAGGASGLVFKQFDLDDDEDSLSPTNRGQSMRLGAGNRESFLQNYMNHDILCVVNFNGISFYDNAKRDKVLQRISYDELLYVMGAGDVLRLSFLNKNTSQSMKAGDIRLDLFTTFGQNARLIAEDIVAYCQCILAECSRNDMIEIVKRNIINIFEDMEDPFAAAANPDDLGLFDITSNSSPGRNRSSNNTFKRQMYGSNPIDKLRKSNIGAFDFLGDGGDFSQASPDKNTDTQLNVKQLQHKLGQQRGQQFRFRDKILIYLKKYPLYLSRQMQNSPSKAGPDQSSSTSSLGQHRNTLLNKPGPGTSNVATANKFLGVQSSGSGGGGSFGSSQGGSGQGRDRQSIFKLQLTTQRIEEDKDEDQEDDSTSIKDYYTADDVDERRYHTSGGGGRGGGGEKLRGRNLEDSRGGKLDNGMGFLGGKRPLSHKSGGDLSPNQPSPIGTSSHKLDKSRNNMSDTSSLNLNQTSNTNMTGSKSARVNQTELKEQQHLGLPQSQLQHRESATGLRSGFNMKPNTMSFVGNQGYGRKESQLTPKTQSQAELGGGGQSSAQLAVINELFSNKPIDEVGKGKKVGQGKQPPKGTNLLRSNRLDDENNTSPSKSEDGVSQAESNQPQAQGETMVLGQKVNYDEMNKDQKKENLNNILAAAFNFMPPPPL